MTNGEDPAKTDLDARVNELEAAASPQLEGLADRVSGAFWDNIKDFFATLFAYVWQSQSEFLPELIDAAVTKSGDESKPGAAALSFTELIDRVNTETDPRQIVAFYEDLLKNYPFLDWLMSLVIMVSGLGQIMLAETSASKELFWQSAWRRDRPALIPMETWIAHAFKNPELIEEVKTQLTSYGFQDEFIDVIFSAATEKLPPQMARDAFLRGFINEYAHDETLKAHRYGDTAIEQMKQLYQVIPPIPDLILMAVREVFSPEVVSRFGQMEDFPAEFGEWAEKQGLTTEWAQNYWAAHWNLPSALQGFEMLHRGVVGEDDLNLLLRALDIMPFWRERLTEIAYNPFTRVDVRRMFALGILDEEQVKRSYLDLGYNEEKATAMTQFTVAYTLSHERDLTRTDITALYKKSALNSQSALDMLMEMGYTEINAELIMTRAELEKISSYKNKRVEAVRKLYVAGRIKENTVIDRLGRMDLPADEINASLELWDVERDSKVRYFTVDQISKMYKADVIDRKYALDELQEIGYSATDAELLVLLVDKAGVS